MVIRCPDCKTLMRPKPPEGTKPGAKVGITCRCGARLRFAMPGVPRVGPNQQAPRSTFAEMAEAMRILDRL